MNSERDKAQSFLGRLLENPALAGFNVLQREEQILQFLNINQAQLTPTLTSPEFFPGKPWAQIYLLLTTALYDVVNSEVVPIVKSLVEERINFSFIPFLQQTGYSPQKVQGQLLKLVAGLLKRPEARRGFTESFTTLYHGLIDQYIDEVFERKSYVHFELTKVQRLRMSKEEVKGLLATTVLLKPAMHLMAGEVAGNAKDRLVGIIPSQFAEKIGQYLKAQVPSLPEPVLDSASHVGLSFQENRHMEATSRLAAIFTARARTYRADQKADRGADTPDKSWLGVARRNSKFYGFDIKMIDELYAVATERGW